MLIIIKYFFQVWENFEVKEVLKGHGAPIWDVAIYPGHGTYLSASGDKTIRLWKDGGYFNNTINADCRLLRAF